MAACVQRLKPCPAALRPHTIYRSLSQSQPPHHTCVPASWPQPQAPFAPSSMFHSLLISPHPVPTVESFRAELGQALCVCLHGAPALRLLGSLSAPLISDFVPLRSSPRHTRSSWRPRLRLSSFFPPSVYPQRICSKGTWTHSVY